MIATNKFNIIHNQVTRIGQYVNLDVC